MGKFVKLLGFLLLAWVLLVSPAWGLTWYVANSTTTYTWTDTNPVGKVASFEVTLTRDVTGEKFVYTTTTTSVKIQPNKVDKNGKRLKSGKYLVEVKAIGTNGLASTSCKSTDISCATLKTGVAGDWKIQYKPAGPTGPITVE